MLKNNKIAVTSRSFSNHSLLREELLKRFDIVTFNEKGIKLSGDSLVQFLSGHDKAIIALEKIDESILNQLPQLKVISKYGVGLDMVDLEAMRNHKVKLGWQGGVNKRSVSELVIAFAIVLLHKVNVANKEVIKGVWKQQKGNLLSEKTVGIIGCGHIGKDVAFLCKTFGCNLIANDILDFPEFYFKYNIQPVSLEFLLKNADIVTIHTPLDVSTKNILSSEKLALLKPTSILINLARGGLVDEVYLKSMLINNTLAAAAFDVFEKEPPEDEELLKLPNFFVTPHIGGSTEEAILAMGRAAIEGLENNEIPK